MTENQEGAKGMLIVVGLGPGSSAGMTQQARDALEASDVIVGYTTYIKLIEKEFAHKPMRSTGMRKEVERCRMALEEAAAGKTVAMVCSGDPGVFAMAGLCYELSVDFPTVEIQVVPGVTAANAGAAMLGAPLIHDFAVISLSDLLTPWETIEKRLEAAAKADFCICLYNPSSHKRADYLQRACDILLRHRSPENACGIASNIGREGQDAAVCTLGELRDIKVDMFSTVFIGNSTTRIAGDKLVTPRGYLQKEQNGIEEPAGCESSPNEAGAAPVVLVFGGTSEGRELVEWLVSLDACDVVACQATEYGTSLLPESTRVTALTERMDAQAMRTLMESRPFVCVIDATHPYAAEVSANIEEAADATGLPLVRVARYTWDKSALPFVYGVRDAYEAAHVVADIPGNVLLTTGSKELAVFVEGIPDALDRVYARVLPVESSLASASKLGIPASHIIAMQGPFSQVLNEALIQSLDIKVMVTKASGAAGGFMEKVQAACSCGIELVVIEPPTADDGLRFDEAKALIGERIGL